MKSLKSTFEAQKTWHNNRASTIFPVFYINNIETYLVFQNYWKWKSNNNQCQINIRIFNSNGDLITLFSDKISKDHNEISVSGILKKKIGSYSEESFFTAEAEIISLENLGFPFPALMIFVVDQVNHQVSCVHSAGRILNSNEQKKLKLYEETNWLAIQNDNFTPFFHIFNPGYDINSNEEEGFIEICVEGDRDSNIRIGFKLPKSSYASKIYYLNDFLSSKQIQFLSDKKFYITVSFYSYGFMRLIVGNLYLRTKFHYITHSFGKIPQNAHDITETENNKISCFLPMLNIKPLNLLARSYPTNISIELNVEKKDFLINTNTELNKHYSTFNSSNFDQKINEFYLDETLMRLYTIKGPSPSRINVSYNYRLKNSIHPTDIATGFKSFYYPKKYSHWGHGFILDGFKTVLMLRRVSHEKEISSEIDNNSIEIEFIVHDYKFTKSLNILNNNWNFVFVDSLDFKTKGKLFFSWRFKDRNSHASIESFWVSYCEDSGAICGEHGF